MESIIPSLTMQQFPLSPKKFWKKVIDKSFLYIILATIGFVILVIITLAVPQDKGSVFAVGMAILSGLSILFLFFFGLPYSFYIRAYIRRYFYDCSDNFITIRKGVFAPTEIHVQYQKIQDVYVDQDIIDRILGLYDVHIASATYSSGIASHIDGVGREEAEGLKQMLLNKVQGYASGINPTMNIPLGGVSESQQPVQITNTTHTGISEQSYPISGAWYVPKIFGNILGSIITFLIIWAKTASDQNSGVILLFFFAIWVISTIVHLIGIAIWKHNFKFAFGPEYITLKQGIISREERHVPYKTIQDVRITQGVFERMLGISTVVIENATASGPVLNFGSLNASGLQTPNGITIPGQPLAKGQELVAIVNDIIRNNKTSSTGL